MKVVLGFTGTMTGNRPRRTFAKEGNKMKLEEQIPGNKGWPGEAGMKKKVHQGAQRVPR